MQNRKETPQDILNSCNLGAKIWVAFDSVRHYRESMDHEFKQLMNGHRYAKGWDVLLGDIGWELFDIMYYLKESIQKERIAQLLDLIKVGTGIRNGLRLWFFRSRVKYESPYVRQNDLSAHKINLSLSRRGSVGASAAFWRLPPEP